MVFTDVYKLRFLPVYILLRFECVQHSTGEGSRGEVEVDSVHPGVFVQLQHLLYNLHSHKDKTLKKQELLFFLQKKYKVFTSIKKTEMAGKAFINFLQV